MSNNERSQVEYQQEMVAEHAYHPWLVEPAAKHDQASIDAHQNQCPASQGVHNRPLAAFLLAIEVACRIDCTFQLGGCGIVLERLIVVADVVVSGVLPPGLVEFFRDVNVVLNHKHILPLAHLITANYQAAEQSDESASCNAQFLEKWLLAHAVLYAFAP